MNNEGKLKEDLLTLMLAQYQIWTLQSSLLFTDVNVEHCQTMLALLYTLSEDNKKQVFTSLCKTMMTALDTPPSQLVAMIPLPITRLCLLIEYMMCHLSTAPDELLQQVREP